MIMKFVKGAVAGAIAGYVLKKVDGALRAARHEEKSQEQAEQEQLEAQREAIDNAIDDLPVELDATQREWAARLLKYGLSFLVASLTRSLRNKLADGRGSILGGALFGLATYGIVEQLIEPALGISPSPMATPAEDHVRGAVSHTAYGIADSAARSLLRL